MVADSPKTERCFRFPRRLRLTRPSEFEAVLNANVRVRSGPLFIGALPNDRDHPRLGLIVSRRVGNAVVRNRVKRQLREAFRLSQHDLPTGYDLVVSVRAHEPLTSDVYRTHLLETARELDRLWRKKQQRQRDPQ
ncbi:MAG: ribonuclease P protein component [Phycisphaerales bacterium]|nr:MAG: ribonuclease P protein component [Phycisphaerales bacterium]